MALPLETLLAENRAIKLTANTTTIGVQDDVICNISPVLQALVEESPNNSIKVESPKTVIEDFPHWLGSAQLPEHLICFDDVDDNSSEHYQGSLIAGYEVADRMKVWELKDRVMTQLIKHGQTYCVKLEQKRKIYETTGNGSP